jgi:hypothetical protein
MRFSWTNVCLEAIEKYIISEFELRKLSDHLKEARPYLFKTAGRSSRNIKDNSRILAQIQTFSKNVNLDLRVYILPHANNKFILNRYKIEREIKESTFSHTYMVS